MGNTHSMLTDEIISDILTYTDSHTLYHCALVNHQLLWRTVYIPQNQAIAFLYRLTTPNRFLGYSIQHLHLEDFAFPDNLLLLLMTRTPSMVSVVLDNGPLVTDRSMQYVPDYWPHLDSIQLTGSTMTDFHVFDTVRHLELWGCSGLSPTTFGTPFALETLIIDMHDTLALDLSGLSHLRDLRVYGGLARDSYHPTSPRFIWMNVWIGWIKTSCLCFSLAHA